MRILNLTILSWFGSGYSPKAPGTAGSLAALPFAWAIASVWGPQSLVLASLIAFGIGWAAANASPEAQKDPGWVVIDEVSGQWLTLAFVPPDVLLYAIGFIAFRIFDIFKPWPIRTLEQKVPGALGVMVDDIAAAVYAAILLYFATLVLGN
ncbi:MAG: phosphatidylglycerophosphatase A [Alphaproteobacteria bacterium]|nr:phosphatidylglycerophosphatase A [Alphaproteobacteria bacterium]